VVPGNPDASLLFWTTHSQHAPQTIFRPLGEADGPLSGDILALRRWISGLADPHQCEGRPVRVAALGRAALLALRALPPEKRRLSRFLSLAHLWNDCRTRPDLPAYRKGLEALLNGISWRPTKAALRPVALPDGQASPRLFRIDLAAFGWTQKDWNAVTDQTQSPALEQRTRQSRALSRMTGTDRALVLADAFAATVMTPQIYARLLKLPADLDTLARVLGVDAVAFDAKTDGAHTLRSPITDAPRRFAVFQSRTTRLWLAEDLSRTAGGGLEAPAVGTRVLFRLPNGRPAFAVFNPEGRRVVPRSDEARRLGPKACLSCHAGGPRAVSAVAEAGQQSGDSFRALLAADQRPTVTAAGNDSLSALIGQYTAPVDLSRAAAEYGVAGETFTGIVSELVANGDLLARRLSTGRLQRAEFVDLIRRIARTGEPNTREGAPKLRHAEFANGGFVIWSERERVSAGDPLVFQLASTTPCYPTLVSIGSSGDAIVLYPNGYDPPTLIEPGQIRSIPEPSARYAFRASGSGGKRIMAFCSETKAPILGLTPDYTRQVFPILGAWPDVLQTSADHLRSAGSFRRRRRAARRRTRTVAEPQPPRRLLTSQTRYVVRPQ